MGQQDSGGEDDTSHTTEHACGGEENGKSALGLGPTTYDGYPFLFFSI